MFILGNALNAVVVIANQLLFFYTLVILVAVILSWVQADPRNPIVRIIGNLTEPAVQLIRNRIPTFFGGLDFAPLILLLAISFIRLGILPSVSQLALMLQN